MTVVPYGYCQCGCGEKTRIATKTRAGRGWVKGHPVRYLPNHHRRSPAPDARWDNERGCFVIGIGGKHEVLVDKCDFDKVSGGRWYPVAGKGTWYAAASAAGSKALMHRIIIEAPEDRVVDHRNGNGLDNRRSNLRVCTVRENVRNRTRKNANNSSGYIGVSWHRPTGKWCAEVYAGEKVIVGYYHCPVEAAVARDVAALEVHGDFAGLNFPRLSDLFATITIEEMK